MVFQINLACTPFQFFLHFTSESYIKIIDFFKENFPLHELALIMCGSRIFERGSLRDNCVYQWIQGLLLVNLKKLNFSGGVRNFLHISLWGEIQM